MDNINCTQFQWFCSIISYNGLLGTISLMAIKKMGNVNAVAIHNFFESALKVLSSAERSGAFGTKSIPQMGQEPASCFIISGCIGQVYCSDDRDDRFCSSTKSIPQTGQSPGLS